MVKTTPGYIELEDGRLYYEMAGEGLPLVMGHAGFVDSGMWDPQWEIFAQHYQVIRFDMRGYGKSDPVTGPRARRYDLAQLLKELHLQRAILLGCSMGGGIMLDFTLEHLEAVLALITVSSAPGGFQMQGDPPPNLLAMMAAAQQGDIARTSELQLRIWVDGPFRQPDQVRPEVRQRAAEMNLIPVKQNTWALADVQPLHPLTPPAVERLQTIQMPTLNMAGLLDHPEVVRAAEVMAARIPGAQKHLFAHSAHIPNMEEPEEFTQVVLKFLSAVKA